MTEFADSQVTYVDLAGEAWGSFRLVVGGKDVTYFRDVPAQIAGYQLIEPYEYGPADFAFPQVSMFEVDAWGTGDLSWFGEGKTVKLKQVDASGAVVRVVWKGFVSLTEVTMQGTRVHCEGDASGRLSLRTKTPELFALKRRVGRRLYNAFDHCRLNLSPHLGGTIGVETFWRGESGRMIDYTDALLAMTIDTDGSQKTIRAKASGGYQLVDKDTTTVDFTAFLGAHGVDPDLSSDMSEKPNVIYGSGISPDGLVWVNGKAPNLQQGEAPDYPMDDGSSFGSGTTDADTDSGDGVSVMQYKLIGGGYLARRDKPGGYDDDVVEAVKDLQEDAGIPAIGTLPTGIMTPATWRALWDLDVTGVSLLQAYQAPLAQTSRVRKWNYTSSGAAASLNPNFDPSVIPVDWAIDYPGIEKLRARRNARGLLARSQSEVNWAGTLTLTSDVFSGAVHATDGDLADHAMSRLDITAGMNVRLRHFAGDVLFHVSVVNVSVSADAVTVQLGVDTLARDAATLGEVIARRIESRSHLARSWKRGHLSNVNVDRIQFSEFCGWIWNKVRCSGDDWTIIPIPAGEAGYISRIRIETSGPPAVFVAALTAQKVSPQWYRQHIGNPFDVNANGESKWTNPSIQHLLDTQRSLLGVWGDATQPCGYFPRLFTNPLTGEVAEPPVTGVMLEDAGIDYHTFDQPEVYLAIYSRDHATTIKPQRILWDLLQNSAG